jgi:hypothetical protein
MKGRCSDATVMPLKATSTPPEVSSCPSPWTANSHLTQVTPGSVMLHSVSHQIISLIEGRRLSVELRQRPLQVVWIRSGHLRCPPRYAVSRLCLCNTSSNSGYTQTCSICKVLHVRRMTRSSIRVCA